MDYQSWFSNPVTIDLFASVHKMSMKQLQSERTKLNNEINTTQHSIHCLETLRNRHRMNTEYYESMHNKWSTELEHLRAKLTEVERELESRRSADM